MASRDRVLQHPQCVSIFLSWISLFLWIFHLRNFKFWIARNKSTRYTLIKLGFQNAYSFWVKRFARIRFFRLIYIQRGIFTCYGHAYVAAVSCRDLFALGNAGTWLRCRRFDSHVYVTRERDTFRPHTDVWSGSRDNDAVDWRWLLSWMPRIDRN